MAYKPLIINAVQIQTAEVGSGPLRKNSINMGTPAAAISILSR
jgi:hypothetical protein